MAQEFDAVARHLSFLAKPKAGSYREKVAAAEAALADAEEQIKRGHYGPATKHLNRAHQVMPRQHVGLYRRYGALVDQVLAAEKKGGA